MAATWNEALSSAEVEVVGIEGRAKYSQAQREENTGRSFGLTFRSPNIDVFGIGVEAGGRTQCRRLSDHACEALECVAIASLYRIE